MRPHILFALLLLCAATASAQSIRVIYPNGGEKLTAGTPITVTWVAAGVSGEAEVEYTVDGTNWRRIGRPSLASGSLSWTPDRSGTACFVRVSERRGDLSDDSDASFEIAEDPLDITILRSPNGGEVWTEGETRTISWQVPLDAVGVTLELSTTGGATWSTVVELPATLTSYQWTVPHLSDADITLAMMRVSMTEGPDHFDISDAPFTIRPKSITPPPEKNLQLVSPNGGEVWREGEIDSILWTAPPSVVGIAIEVSLDNGATFHPILIVPAATGAFGWRIPRIADTASTQVMVRITDTARVATPDTSDGSFTIIPKPAPIARVGESSLVTGTLAAPNPTAGTTTIEWTQTMHADVSVHLFAADGRLVHEAMLGRRDSGRQSTTIDLGSAVAGAYFYELRLGPERVRGMIVRQQ